MNKRQIVESPIYQGSEEQVGYTLTTTPWGSSPTSPSVVLKTYPGLIDVSAAYLSGSASVSGDVITTPVVGPLATGIKYRMEIKFSCSEKIYKAWTDIEVEP